MDFNLKKTAIYRSLLLSKIPFLSGARFLWKCFLFLFFASFFIFALKDNLGVGPYFLELGVLFFVLFLLFLELDLFFEMVKKPKLFIDIKEAEKNIEKVNIAEFLDFRSAQIISDVQRRRVIDSYSLLYCLLKRGKSMDFIFYRLLIDKKQLLRDVGVILKEENRYLEKSYLPCFEKTMRKALSVAAKAGNERITPEDLFTALSEHNNYLRDMIYRSEITEEDVFDLVSWKKRLEKKEDPLLYKNLIKQGSLGRKWTFGFTPFLDNFCTDWTRVMQKASLPKTIGHKEEVESLERVLSRDKLNNVILVGNSGSGTRSVIKELARKTFLGESLPEINYYRILELNLSSILARAEGAEETEKTLDMLFEEAARAGNIILVISKFHNFTVGEKRPGVINISGVLEPYLQLPSFRLVGITDFMGFRRNVEKNSSLVSLMEKVEVKEISLKETLILLERMALFLERKYRKLISYPAIKKAISFSERYMQNDPFPEKAFTLLEEAVVHIDQKGEDILVPAAIAKIVSEKTEVPVGKLEKSERETLLNLEKLIHKRIVNQENAVSAVSSALRRARTDVATRGGLIGSFLFLGPTGVGKTETAKAIADIYFGSEKKINRIDMSEFQSISDIGRLIGSSTEDGILTSQVKEDPFSLVLLDEIEKAHPDILNLFLQILDEGHITDGVGRKVDFRNSMVIATSNAGYQIILDAIKENKEWSKVKEDILNDLFRGSTFRPEFINRFDEVVLFKPLGKKELVSIAGLQLEKMTNNFKEKDMSFVVTKELKERIVEMSYDPVFGAREMQRAIQDNIGNELASAVLNKKIKKGDRFTINAETLKLEKMT